jgi:hypothetical protein
MGISQKLEGLVFIARGWLGCMYGQFMRSQRLLDTFILSKKGEDNNSALSMTNRVLTGQRVSAALPTYKWKNIQQKALSLEIGFSSRGCWPWSGWATGRETLILM